MRKVVFLDIDGTLTTFGGILPDSAHEALKKARAAGHELVICTGRTITQVYPNLLETGLFTGVVSGAGADVRRMGELISLHEIDPEQHRFIIDYIKSKDMYYYIQSTSGVYTEAYVNETAGELFAGMPKEPEEQERLFGKITVVEDPWAIADAQKYCFYRSPDEIPVMQENIGDYWEIMTSSFCLTDKPDGELTHRGIDKSYGMRKYLEAAGLTKEDTIAFGDGPNDFEMLQFAQIGVAMGNGLDALKESADMVTGRVDENGLYDAFEKLGLFE